MVGGSLHHSSEAPLLRTTLFELGEECRKSEREPRYLTCFREKLGTRFLVKRESRKRGGDDLISWRSARNAWKAGGNVLGILCSQ